MASKLLILSNVNLISFPLFCSPLRIYNLIVFGGDIDEEEALGLASLQTG